jgi:Cys-rich repeat protein
MTTTRFFVSALLFAVAGAATVAGCKSSDSTARQSSRGEECQTTADCAGNLACVPRPNNAGGGICVDGQFNVAPTNKECVVIECTQASDCVQPGACPTSCPTYQMECSQGIQSACTTYQQLCGGCSASHWACDNGTCKTQCTTAADCGIGNAQCTNGQCVQCTDDSQCTNGNVCNNNICTPPCMSDTDCSSFNRCTNGKCTKAGCASDRECIAATKNVTAVCKSNTCVVPCQTDLECGNPESYNFYSCIKNQCIYVGCQTDKECQLYLGQQGGTHHGQIVCQDKPAM